MLALSLSNPIAMIFKLAIVVIGATSFTMVVLVDVGIWDPAQDLIEIIPSRKTHPHSRRHHI
ncbi:hypothetical protein HYC85_010624 [Camellia sinensis]|uniref:Uncharacterized protein n=1 Tax=Camellia sinensis TaxID=4442 RepID=A0A7J7HIE6_CAMSI|nr:hypothetical protein HYC85_010624 [Camellia sinensis]